MRRLTLLLYAALFLVAGPNAAQVSRPGVKPWPVLMTGLPSNPPEPEVIPEATLVKLGLCGGAPRSGGHLNGCFHYSYEWRGSPSEQGITIDFGLAISLSDAVKAGKRPGVLAHEHRHFYDFLNLANRLRLDLEATARANGNPDMENRMAWFRFDTCRADENYHLSLKQSLWGTAACAGLKPRAGRPVTY